MTPRSVDDTDPNCREARGQDEPNASTVITTKPRSLILKIAVDSSVPLLHFGTPEVAHCFPATNDSELFPELTRRRYRLTMRERAQGAKTQGGPHPETRPGRGPTSEGVRATPPGGLQVRAALYARVSTEEQAERYGLASQVTELRELFGRYI